MAHEKHERAVCHAYVAIGVGILGQREQMSRFKYQVILAASSEPRDKNASLWDEAVSLIEFDAEHNRQFSGAQASFLWFC